MKFSYESKPISTIMNDIKTKEYGGLDLQPDYQRAFIWNKDFKDKLIYSIFKKYPIGSVSIRIRNDVNEVGATQEVVDGQQRLTTIYNFITGKYEIKGEYAKLISIKIIERYNDKFPVDDTVEMKKIEKIRKRTVLKGPKLVYEDLPSLIKNDIDSFNINVTAISNAGEEEIREYFKFLQNQEKLKAGEIINSLPESQLEKYLRQIEDKDGFTNVINYKNERKEFEKIYYSIIGLFDEKLQLGSEDKKIQKYVGDALDVTVGEENVKCMINEINNITKFENNLPRATKKRFLKFLLILSGLNYVNFNEEKLRRLQEIDELFTILSSSSKSKVSLKGYSEEVLDELNSIALLGKCGHSLSRVKNRMEILAYYVNNPINKTEASKIVINE